MKFFSISMHSLENTIFDCSLKILCISSISVHDRSAFNDSDQLVDLEHPQDGTAKGVTEGLAIEIFETSSLMDRSNSIYMHLIKRLWVMSPHAAAFITSMPQLKLNVTTMFLYYSGKRVTPVYQSIS